MRSCEYELFDPLLDPFLGGLAGHRVAGQRRACVGARHGDGSVRGLSESCGGQTQERGHSHGRRRFDKIAVIESFPG